MRERERELVRGKGEKSVCMWGGGGNGKIGRENISLIKG